MTYVSGGLGSALRAIIAAEDKRATTSKDFGIRWFYAGLGFRGGTETVRAAYLAPTSCYKFRTNGTSPVQSKDSGPARSCLPSVVRSLRDRWASLREVQCSTAISSPSCELIPVEALSTKRILLLWCFGWGTEFTYTPTRETVHGLWLFIRGWNRTWTGVALW